MVSKNWKDSFPWDKCTADVREGTVSPLLSQQHRELCAMWWVLSEHLLNECVPGFKCSSFPLKSE